MDLLTKRFIDSYEYLKAEGIVKNDSDLVSKLNVSRSSITEVLKGRSNPGAKLLQNFVNIYPIDGTWLLTGQGEMMKTGVKYADTPADNWHVSDQETGYTTHTPVSISGDKSQKASKKVTPTVTPTTQNTILLTPQIITVDRRGQENIVYVPVRARAGYLTGYGDPEFIENLPSFSLPGLQNATYRAFEVDGESMYPTLKNREMVIGQWVEKLDYIRDDRVHILVTKNDGIIIKRVLNRIEKHGVIIAKSDALDKRNLYPNLQLKPEDITEIWYAVWHGGFDFQAPGDVWNRLNNNDADITMLQSTVERLMQRIEKAGI